VISPTTVVSYRTPRNGMIVDIAKSFTAVSG
jgi:hypothetical protein